MSVYLESDGRLSGIRPFKDENYVPQSKHAEKIYRQQYLFKIIYFIILQKLHKNYVLKMFATLKNFQTEKIYREKIFGL